MKYIVKEHYCNGDIFDRFIAISEAEAMRYIELITGGIAEKINGRYYNKRNVCGAIRTSYSIEPTEEI